MYCSKCGTVLEDGVQFCYNCGCKIGNNDAVSKSVGSVDSKNNTESLKEYLTYAKTLEVNKYTLQTAKDKLQNKIDSLGLNKQINKPRYKSRGLSHYFWPVFTVVIVIGLLICLFACGNVWVNLLCFLTVFLIFFHEELLIGVGISLGAAVGCGIIACIIGVITEIVEYKHKSEEYKKMYQTDNIRVEKEKKQITELMKQQAELTDKITEVDGMLSKLYSLNVIYPKYRGFVPIVTIHEYFESGRHTNLTDAYNKYEDELIHKQISDKLEVIVNQLDNIRENQYAIYDAVQTSNYIAGKIYRQSEEMLESNKAIERNSEIAAYSSKLAADYNRISTYIDIYNM